MLYGIKGGYINSKDLFTDSKKAKTIESKVESKVNVKELKKNFKKFKGNSEKLKEMQVEKVRKEKLIFLSLCSERDGKRITGAIDLHIRDFERIVCLLDMLGLNHFLLEFEMSHPDLLEQLANKIENDVKLGDEKKLNMERNIRQQWLEEFCNQLPSQVMRVYIKELFGM